MRNKVLYVKKKVSENGCTGCGACVNICPNKAVSMERNEEGFWESRIEETKCTECGRCRSVCHLAEGHLARDNRMPSYYAAVSKDVDNVEHSSSGGIFFELCKKILGESGVVYGAVQESVFEVVHRRAETQEQAELFRRSKYLESRTGTCYREVEKDLEKGRKVLFSGVGCQIAGLYCYLGKKYENLFTCEVVCHGIPSHLAYEKYLEEMEHRLGDAVCGIVFRDKSRGWRNNSICESYKSGRKSLSSSSVHPLHAVYLKGINMRSICGFCRYAHVPRTADITLADFWQYKGKLVGEDWDEGISLIAVNNEQGEALLKGIADSILVESVEEEMALESCRHMNHSPILYKSQGAFLQMLRDTDFSTAVSVCSDFGPVIKENELYKTSEVREEEILEVFWRDEREIVYVEDGGKKLKGIITCGHFLENIQNPEKWVNEAFAKAVLEGNCQYVIKDIFLSNQRINRIPLVDREENLRYEVRRKGTGRVHDGFETGFVEMAEKYEKIFGDKLLTILEKRQAWREKSASSCIFMVDNISRKKILWKKYHVKSICKQELHGEIEKMKPFLQLCLQRTEVYFVKRPDLLEDYEYTNEERERIEQKATFQSLSGNVEANEAILKKLFGDRYSPAYVKALCDVPQIVEKNNRYQHVDHVSDYINVIGGCRRTCGQVQAYHSTVHIYGRCGVFGYAVEDADTMPSILQGLFIRDQYKIRVVNHGLWGGDEEKILHNLSVDIMEGMIKPEDKVILYMDYLTCMERLRSLKLCIIDSTPLFHEFMKGKTAFYDRPGHMTAEGYGFIAKLLYHEIMCHRDITIADKTLQNIGEFLTLYGDHTESEHEKESDFGEAALERYLTEVENRVPYPGQARRGAIVMNCNPFTKGHRYLVETAAGEVDELLIFVVEEEKSFFSFQDRFRMVQNGTKDLKNVHVLPGGKFMISALTFPEYFEKERRQDVKINAVSDVQIFGQKIAPRLHIAVRYAGTEPEDKVTAQYNETLREILGLYGVDFREIDRMKQGEETVTATKVRRLMEEGDREGIRALVYKTTYTYLDQQGFLYQTKGVEI